MSKTSSEKIYVTEHTFELRHSASGVFLDKRGFIAQYIKKAGLFTHWEIQENFVFLFLTPLSILIKKEQ